MIDLACRFFFAIFEFWPTHTTNTASRYRLTSTILISSLHSYLNLTPIVTFHPNSLLPQIRNTSEDLDCHVILIFQRIVKSHLLMLRESLTSSLDSLSPALPEEVLSVFNQCLSTFNILEVPFIFIDNVLLKQEYVKNKIQYHILESREKVEYLAKHQLATLRELRSLAGHSPSGPRNLSRQNLKTKRRITQVCVDVQALHFQFCSLYRTFSNVVDLVCELRKEEQVLDLSDYVSDLASRLFQVLHFSFLLVITFYLNFT